MDPNLKKLLEVANQTPNQLEFPTGAEFAYWLAGLDNTRFLTSANLRAALERSGWVQNPNPKPGFEQWHAPFSMAR
ncbi:hypothetical protein HYW55_01310 [Candidatus Gottesmanbacteria bacterium]|nr:hypothetical protein [Candidatus Gottesmanbacteria bacterium]